MFSPILRSLPLLALTGSVVAQGTCDLAKTTNGALGTPLTLRLSNAPLNRSALFMLSTNAGPTPLSAVDPRDTRALSVGLELAAFWFTAPTGNGTLVLGIPIPNDPNLAGASLHLQAVTYFGTSLAFGAISNPVVQQLGIAGTPIPLPARLVAPRALGTVFPSDGDVLVAGGGQGGLLSATGLATSEHYDFETMTVRAGPSLGTPRALAASAILADGRVLLAGGVDATGSALATAVVYDPATRAFVPTNPMSRPRALHEATTLADGRVLVVGGTTSTADPVQAASGAQATAEIWDPATGRWTTAAGMSDRLLGPDLTTMLDGRVLLSGGYDVDSVFGIPLPVGSIPRCRIYNPTSNTWSSAAAMNDARMAHGINTVLLGDGRILVTGGASAGIDPSAASAIAGAEIYDPAGNAWTPLPPMAFPRSLHTVTTLPNATVLVAGGASGTLAAPVELTSVQMLDLVTGNWRSLAPLNTARAGHAAALMPDGMVVVFGGQGQGGAATLSSIETIRP